jgi:hypothetical protein
MAMGLWMPLCLLAAWGASLIVAGLPALRGKVGLALGLALSAISNGVVWLALLLGVLGRAPEYFFSATERAALRWLAARPPGEIVLAGEALSALIPVHTDARVIYGHPYETIDAERQRERVRAFFAGEGGLPEPEPDLIVYGPREEPLGPRPALAGWQALFQDGDVTVYGR